MLIPPEVKQKPFEYLALLILLVLAAVLYIVFAFDPHMQRRIIYGAVAAYLGWSVYHHYRRGDLEISIVIEYILISLLALALISSTLI